MTVELSHLCCSLLFMLIVKICSKSSTRLFLGFFCTCLLLFMVLVLHRSCIERDSKVVYIVMALQVARTISNMQQQIQQHQRQLAQALLMKQQQQQPPPSHSGLHPSGAKSTLDSFPGHPQAPGFPDMQTKEPQSSPNTYSSYSLGEEHLKVSF